MKTKNLALIGILGALQVAITIKIPLLSLLVLIVLTLSLTKKQALTLASISAILSLFISFKLVSIINLVLLPVICIGIKLYQEKRMLYCSKNNSLSNYIELGIISFIFIFISNIISEIFAMIIFSFSIEYLIISFPVALFGAIINGIIIGIVGIPLKNRICKILI